jgi:hypothetical protein
LIKETTQVRPYVQPFAGGPGAAPPEKFSSYRSMLVSFSAFFQTKINTLTPAFMPVNFGKSQTLLIFNALRPMTLEKKDTKLRRKLQNDLLSILLLVDDLLLTSSDLV